MDKKNKIKMIAVMAALASVVTISGVMAYFTDTDTQTNNFSVGKIAIDLQEPEWDKKPDADNNGIPDEAENMRPGQTIVKDPQVKNTGINDAFIFLTVQVPCRDIITANPDGTKNAKTLTDLYQYNMDRAWTKLGTYDVKDETGKETVAHQYLYAYATAGGDCTAVQPNKVTNALFSETTFVNAVEGQGLEEEKFDMEIHAYGIQTTDINGGVQTPAEVWKVISNQRDVAEVYK